MLVRTEGISYPRSGHGPLYHTLKRYFGERLLYCDPENRGGDHCGCRRVPCRNPANNFSKNHDFGLLKGSGIKIRSGQQYLVQYRNPVRSVISNFRLFIKRRPYKDSRSGWHAYAKKELAYWNKLTDKWIIGLEDRPDTVWTCPYEQLIREPVATARDVITFMTDEDVDLDRLQREVTAVNIRPLDRSADFQFFDTGFFREMEEVAGTRLAALSIPPFEESV